MTHTIRDYRTGEGITMTQREDESAGVFAKRVRAAKAEMFVAEWKEGFLRNHPSAPERHDMLQHLASASHAIRGDSPWH